LKAAGAEKTLLDVIQKRLDKDAAEKAAAEKAAAAAAVAAAATAALSAATGPESTPDPEPEPEPERELEPAPKPTPPKLPRPESKQSPLPRTARDLEVAAEEVPADRAALDADVEAMVKEHLDNPDASQTLTMQMWDFGGQKLFLMLHHLFLEPEGIYLVVFNGQELVLEVGDELVGKPLRITTEDTAAECIEYLSLWLNSIYTFAPGAPVFVVCTCRDLLTEEQQQRIEQKVGANVLDKTPCDDQVVTCDETKKDIFFVDNTDSDDASVRALRRQIETVIAEHPYIEPHVRMRMPVEWLKVLDNLTELVKSNRQRIPRNEFVEIARDCGLGTTRISLEDEVDGLLLKFHTLGLLVWHNKPSLRNMVVLDPQWLINAAATIIRDPALHQLEEIDRKLRRKLKASFTRLYEEAVLDAVMLPHIFPDPPDGTYTAEERDQLVQLFEQFVLAVPLTSVADGKRQWLIPALLKSRSLDDSPRLLQNTSITNVCFIYFYTRCGCRPGGLGNGTRCSCPALISRDTLQEDGFLPDGLFPRVIGMLVSSHHRHNASKSVVELVPQAGQKEEKGGFILEHLPTLNAIKLSTVPGNPLGVYRGVIAAIDESIAMIGDGLSDRLHLQLLLQCPSQHGDGFVRKECLDDSGGADVTNIIVGGTLFAVAQLRRDPPFNSWYDAVGGSPRYDVFISYKHGNDSAFAEKLYDCQQHAAIGPSGRRPRVYLDKKRSASELGKQLRNNLLDALCHSRVVVPVISCSFLESMETTNGCCDWLLLECWAMVELFDLRQNDPGRTIDVVISRICPIAVGFGDGDGNLVGGIFDDEQKQRYVAAMPSTVHGPTHLELTAYFQQAGLVLPETPKTVQEIVRRLLGFAGIDRASSEHSNATRSPAVKEEEWYSDQIRILCDDAVPLPVGVALSVDRPSHAASPDAAVAALESTPNSDLAVTQPAHAAPPGTEPHAVHTFGPTNSPEARIDDISPEGPRPSTAIDPASSLNPVLEARGENLWDMFLSHCQAEAGQQTAILADQLELRGLNSWFDQWNMKGSEATGVIDVTKAGMMKGVQQSAVFVLVLTKSVFTRPFCRLEIITAIKAGKPIVTVMETDPRFDPIDFSTIKQGVPGGFHKIIDRITSEVCATPIRRDGEERKLMLSKIFGTYVRGLAKAVSFTQVEIAEAEAALDAQSDRPVPEDTHPIHSWFASVLAP